MRVTTPIQLDVARENFTKYKSPPHAMVPAVPGQIHFNKRIIMHNELVSKSLPDLNVW